MCTSCNYTHIHINMHTGSYVWVNTHMCYRFLLISHHPLSYLENLDRQHMGRIIFIQSSKHNLPIYQNTANYFTPNKFFIDTMQGTFLENSNFIPQSSLTNLERKKTPGYFTQNQLPKSCSILFLAQQLSFSQTYNFLSRIYPMQTAKT